MTSYQNTQMALQQRSSAGTWGMAKKKIQVKFCSDNIFQATADNTHTLFSNLRQFKCGKVLWLLRFVVENKFNFKWVG